MRYHIEIVNESGYHAAMLGLSLSYNKSLCAMYDVAKKLYNKDGGHNKFLESIQIWLDIKMPRYWWQEFDTYRVGVTKQSESTVHTVFKRELTQEDFTGGHLRCIGQIIYITAPINGRDYMHEMRESVNSAGQVTAERFWHPPQVRNISRFALIDGVVYGHSSSNPMIYQVWDTGQWHDDTGTEAVFTPYTSVMLLAYINGGRRQGKINFDKLFVEGYAAAAELYAGVYYDYQGATALLSPILNIPESPFPVTFSGVVPPSLGDASLGDNPLGDGLNTAADDQALLAKFKIITGLEQTDCFEFALMIYSSNIDARWEILGLGTNYKLSTANAVEIIKQN